LSRDAAVKRQVFRLPRERRIAEIVAAARAEFREKGYQEALLSDIAERAKVVEGTIYRYFENKYDLLVKVIEHWYETMLSDYDQQLAGISGTRNRLRFMVWRHLTAIHDDPALCQLMFGILRTGADYRGTHIFELNRRYTRRTLDIVQEGIAAGEYRSDTPLGLVRDMIYGCVEHRTWGYLRGEGDFDPHKTADAVVDLVIGGLERGDDRRRDSLAQSVIARLEGAADRLESHADLLDGARGTRLPARAGPQRSQEALDERS
jgi:TetR/AcrR family transcriptional regulator, fatty acid metabolism regulator protein